MRLLQEAQQAPFFREQTGIPFGLHNHIWLEDRIFLRPGELHALDIVLNDLIPAEDWSFLVAFADLCEEALAKISKTAASISEEPNLAELSPDNLFALVQGWLSAYRSACAFVPVFRSIDKLLVTHLGGSAPHETAPARSGGLTEEEQERRSVRLIASQLRGLQDPNCESEKAEQLLAEHLHRFSWLGMRWYLGTPTSCESVRQRVQALVSHPIPAITRMACEGAPKAVSPKDALIERLALLRTTRAEAVNKAIWVSRPLLEEVGRRLGFSYSEVVQLLPDEIAAACEGSPQDRGVALLRQEAFGSVLLEDTFQELTGKDAVLKFANSEVAEHALMGGASRHEPTTPGVLRGTIASEGLARGKAKAVQTADDCTRLMEGDVMVSVMTYPSFVGAMEKASAIITEDGGLLSHAAVVARELGKPCLIEVADVTRLLRDGEMIEVDCFKGIVQRLEAVES